MDASPAARADNEALTLVRRLYVLVAAGEIDAVVEMLSPHLVARQAFGLPFGGVYTGRDGFRDMSRRIYDCWPDFRVEPLRFFADADAVVVLTHLTGSRAGADPLDMDMLEYWRAENGRLVEVRPFYWDTAEAASSARV